MPGTTGGSALQGHAVDPLTAHAVAVVERSGGCATIDRVCAETGLQARDLERRFAQELARYFTLGSRGRNR